MSTSAIGRISDVRRSRETSSLRSRWLAVAALALLAACQHGGVVSRERLDEKSGVTIIADTLPIVFARTETRFSRSGRDYLYLGPVETNRQGLREYYLWVGVASTLDRGYIAPESALPDRVIVDGRRHGDHIGLGEGYELGRSRARNQVVGAGAKVGVHLAACWKHAPAQAETSTMVTMTSMICPHFCAFQRAFF